MNQNQSNDNEVSSESTSLGSYFDSSTPTIFDEIVSNKKIDDVFDTNASTKFNMPLGKPSGNIFENDSSFEEQSSQQTTISDVHRDAWIPSEDTKKILRSLVTSGNFNTLDKENLTMPGLAISEDMIDPIKEATLHFLGEDEVMNRTVLTLAEVTQVIFDLKKIFVYDTLFFIFPFTGRKRIEKFNQGRMLQICR